MTSWRPSAQRQRYSGSDDFEDLNTEFTANRYSMLLDSGAGRFFQADANSLLELAESSLSDSDMVETLMVANDQVRLNQLKERFESLPSQMQKPEFTLLPKQAQKMLLASGYEVPEDKPKDPLWKRITTWDWPLIPEEFLADKGVIGGSPLGDLAKVALAPVRATGFVLGKGASGAWEGFMKFSRAANRLGRTFGHIEEDSDITAFVNPPRWRQAWNQVKIEENSYTENAVDEVTALIGSEHANMLRKYLISSDEVYEYFKNQGQMQGWDDNKIRQRYFEFEQRLSSPEFVEAIRILDNSRLDTFNYSIRTYNKHNMGLPDVERDSWAGKAIGLTGSLAVEILLDPLTYVGGFYTKVIKRARTGLTGGNTARTLDLMKKMTLIEREASVAAVGTRRAAFAESVSQYSEDIAAWLQGTDVRGAKNLNRLGYINMNLRGQARAQNRMIDRINRAFREVNEIHDEMYRLQDEFVKAGQPVPPRYIMESQAMENLGLRNPLTELSRDFPALDPIIDDMRNFHAKARGTVVVRLGAEGEETVAFRHLWDDDLKSGDIFVGPDGNDFIWEEGMDNPFRIKDTANMVQPDLSTFDGYWDFLRSTEGQAGLSSRAGGVDPDAMWLPRIGYFGAKWVKGKQYMREVLDFGLPNHALEADLANMFATHLAEQTDYVVTRIADDIAKGRLNLSQPIGKEGVYRIYSEVAAAKRIQIGKQLGLSPDDVLKIEDHIATVMPDAKRLILEDGNMSPLLNWYQDAGFKFDEGAFGKEKLVIKRQAMAVPFSGAGRAARNYYKNQMHQIGSMNAEVSKLEHLKIWGESAAASVAYYPAKWAEKLTTFTPRTPYLDVTDTDTAIREFKALIDMGSLAHMPRSQIDNYLNMFIQGNEAQRWIVQTEFLTDFLGRSGALLHGGEQVQDYIARFIRHAGAHYSLTGADDLGIGGITTRRAILGSAAHEAQLSKLNVIPDYAKLAVLTKHLAFYRKIGWGGMLPWVDKMFARYWRPAVLLRLGYVARNGGEELFSWMLRESPKHYVLQKAAKSAVDSKIVYDEFGRKIIKQADELVSDPALSAQLHQSLIFKPIIAVQRAMNEILGVGDFAITSKALKESVQREGMRWAFLSADEQEKLFLAARHEEMLKVAARPLGQIGRGLFDLGQLMSQKTGKFFHDFAARTRVGGGGIPTRSAIATKFLERFDPDHALRIKLSGYAMTNPTVLDAQMKNILGAYDNYTNFDKNSLHNLVKQQGLGATVPDLVKLPLDYTATEMSFIMNMADDLSDADKAIAMAQTLGHFSDDIGSIAFVGELRHFVSAGQERVLRNTADRLIATMSDYRQREAADSLASGVVLAELVKHRKATKKLSEGFFATGGEPFGLAWNRALDEALEMLPEEVRPIWEDLFRPPLAPVDPLTGAIAPRGSIDTNTAGFLFSGSDPLRLTDNFDEIAQRAEAAYVTAMYTPEGQQVAHSMARANVGTNRQSPVISHPLPDDMLRFYVPMIPNDLAAELTELLVPFAARAQDQTDNAVRFRNVFVQSLQERLDRLGVKGPAAEHARLLLNPAVTVPGIGGGATTYTQLAAHWVDAGENYFPLVTGSTDGRVAHAIAESLLDTMAEYRGVSRETLGSARLSTRDVSGDEFFNSKGGVARVKTDYARADTTTSSSSTTLRDKRDTFGAGFYGYGPEGVAPAAAFGKKGLGKNTVFGVAAHKLVPNVGGLRPVPLLADGTPHIKRLSIYRHKGNRPPVVVREGTEIDAKWYTADEWDLVDEQFVTGDDLYDFATEMGKINKIEILHHLSNVSRGGDPEVFFPWLTEILNSAGDRSLVNAARVGNMADYGPWWGKAPEMLLGYKPVAAEPDGPWMTIIRNWFDGVVNPMIGAMVREPLFQHYFVKAWKQTEDITQLHWHSLDDVRNFKHLGVLDDNGQLVIDEFESFISHDWALAHLDPDTPISKLAFAINDNSPRQARTAIEEILRMKDEAEKALGAPYGKLHADFYARLHAFSDDDLKQFFNWAKGRKISFELHRDAALKRAMTLTGAFIDDHRIRSQFQTMVRTAVPFWFAEDQFLRRLGRSIAHNPLMLRRLNLTMNSLERGGIVQEDSNGNKHILIPGNEMLTNNVLEIVDEIPFVGRFFGGPLGGILRPGGGMAMNINVIPGYDLETMGQMGFGPILAVPINWIGNRDATIRPQFEKNMIGGRWTPDSTLHQFWTSAVPSIVVKPVVAMMAQAGMEPEAVVKAQIDVIKAMALSGRLPTEEDIAAQPNPELFMEELMEKIAQEARHYLWFQTFTWWAGPSTGTDLNLTTADGWEWNQEFYTLLKSGVSWEEAYRTWVDNIVAREGEFDPYQYSPFMTARTDKVPFAVMESTHAANEFIVDNTPFLETYKYSGAFFMPRGHQDGDDEYVSEARSRQIALGLRSLRTAEGYLENLYYDIAQATYFKARNKHLEDRYTAQAAGMSTEMIDKKWDLQQRMFMQSNPIFMKQFQSGDSRVKRESTVKEMKVLIANPDLVPDVENKSDILLGMALIVGFVEGMDRLAGQQGRSVQRARDELRIEAYRTITNYVYGRPYMNELYYSVFMPTLGDTWLAKFNAGLIEV